MADAAARRVSDRGVATPATGPTRLDLPQPARYTPTDQEHQGLSQPAQLAATASTDPSQVRTILPTPARRCRNGLPSSCRSRSRRPIQPAGLPLPAPDALTPPALPDLSNPIDLPQSGRPAPAPCHSTPAYPRPTNPSSPLRLVQPATSTPARSIRSDRSDRSNHSIRSNRSNRSDRSDRSNGSIRSIRPQRSEPAVRPQRRSLPFSHGLSAKEPKNFGAKNLVYKINYFIFATENQSEAPEPSKQTTQKNRENGRYQPHGIPPRRRIRPHR